MKARGKGTRCLFFFYTFLRLVALLPYVHKGKSFFGIKFKMDGYFVEFLKFTVYGIYNSIFVEKKKKTLRLRKCQQKQKFPKSPHHRHCHSHSHTTLNPSRDVRHHSQSISHYVHYQTLAGGPFLTLVQTASVQISIEAIV